MSSKKPFSAWALSRSGTEPRVLPKTCARADPPSLKCSALKLTRTSKEPAFRASSGVIDWRMSATGANPETIRDNGAVLLLVSPCSSQTERMDIESLPTGIQIPSSGHKSSATAFTVA